MGHHGIRIPAVYPVYRAAAQREGFGSLLNLVGYTAIKDTGIFSVKTKVVPVFTVPVLNSPIF